MSLRARTLKASNYRNLQDFSLELSEALTVLVGPNAVGKTNVVESLHLLTSGRSFKTARVDDLLREGCEEGWARLSLEGEGRLIDLACLLQRRKGEVGQGKPVCTRSFERNGKKVSAAGMRGALPSVVFCPDHLSIVKGSASARRDALDSLGVQLSESYASLLQAYKKILEQRNSLLREGVENRALLAVWNESLVSAGASVIMHRHALLERVGEHLRRVYLSLCSHEIIDVAYKSSIVTEKASSLQKKDLEEGLSQLLEEHFEADSRAGFTTCGPHRDDIVFTVDGRETRSFGSQGQQRSVVLAWKIAEVEVVKDILGYPPLLLLDDVMSELDAERRSSMLGFVDREIQTVVTTTNLGYFSEDFMRSAKVVTIDGRR